MRMPPRTRRPAAALIILGLTLSPGLLHWWEGGMLRHMLGQIPLLVLAGALLAPRAPLGGPGAQALPVAAVFATGFCLAFWMLPRWFDAAVTDARVDAAKVVTLVLLAGLPLGWAWPRLGAVARGFVWAHVIGMAAVLGVLYLGFPDRLCNNYLESEQFRLGQAMLALAGALSLWLAGAVLFGPVPAVRAGRRMAGGGRDRAV